jgi:hypothetical protein
VDQASSCREVDAAALNGGFHRIALDPNTFDGIKWTGDQLYHFRVLITEGTYCNLTTEFKVYVFRSPLNSAIESAIISITAFFIGAVLLFGTVKCWFIRQFESDAQDLGYMIAGSATSR